MNKRKREGRHNNVESPQTKTIKKETPLQTGNEQKKNEEITSQHIIENKKRNAIQTNRLTKERKRERNI